jgi:hypothetical protein
MPGERKIEEETALIFFGLANGPTSIDYGTQI